MASQIDYLHEMGIETWILRTPTPRIKTLACLKQQVSECTRCPLHQHRTQTVFNRGNESASLMIIGEAPGFHEDKQGLPFMGKAGSLLNEMIRSIGLQQEDIYIANVIKCRPPSNRDPHVAEIEQCKPYLEEQIALLAPKVILGLGRFAGQFLSNTQLPLGKMRKTVHRYQNIPVIISYHPAYLLRNPADKKKSYADLLSIVRWLNTTANDSTHEIS